MTLMRFQGTDVRTHVFLSLASLAQLLPLQSAHQLAGMDKWLQMSNVMMVQMMGRVVPYLAQGQFWGIFVQGFIQLFVKNYVEMGKMTQIRQYI